MTTWVPSTEDYDQQVTVFRQVENMSAKFLVYSNEAAYHSDIAEADGEFQSGTTSEA